MTKESHISFKAGISRRYFLQVTGAGVVTATALGASAFRAQAEP
ncbi:MAG: ABC transporter substrate-binding protein, partial [Mesorhizobium sp.]